MGVVWNEGSIPFPLSVVTLPISISPWDDQAFSVEHVCRVYRRGQRDPVASIDWNYRNYRRRTSKIKLLM